MTAHRDEHDGVQEHHLVPGMTLPPEDDDEEQGMDEDVKAALDELAKIARAKTKRRAVH